MVQNETKHYFINFLNKKGKKSKTEKAYNKLLLNLKQKTKKNPTVLLQKSISNLRPKIEIKKISRFKSIVVPTTEKKQIHVSLHWLIDSNRKDNIKILTKEVIETIDQNSNSYIKKISLYKEAQKFKFNIK